MPRDCALDFRLHEKQGVAFQSPATEILYGGAAGGGKSHLMRVAAIVWCTQIAGLQVYLFRRIRDDLVKNHIEGPKGFRAMLAPWELAGLCKIVEDEIRFWNGSKIYLCHCKDEKDRYKYLGAEIHVLLVDELTTFTATIYRFLRGRVRAVGLPTLPAEYAGCFPRILCGSNPGSIGHQWVKAAFIDNAAPLEIVRQPDSEGGMLRQYIPAKLSDNPSMAQDDPGYDARLGGLGNAELVRAMRDGDWDIVVGAFFTEWSRKLHVIRPCSLPEHWARFRVMDWGSYRPFSVGWYAVSDGELSQFPRGALIRYREWYGVRTHQDGGFEPNVGLKLTAAQVRDGIVDRSRGEKYVNDWADPAIFSRDGGPSIAERMLPTKDRPGIVWSRADNARVARAGAMGGWDQVRERLIGEDGRPMIYVFDTGGHLIRTLPALQHDELRPEDVDTEQEDHAPDELRYACMSRPYIAPKPKMEQDVDTSMPTINDLIAAAKRRRERVD